MATLPLRGTSYILLATSHILGGVGGAHTVVHYICWSHALMLGLFDYKKGKVRVKGAGHFHLKKREREGRQKEKKRKGCFSSCFKREVVYS